MGVKGLLTRVRKVEAKQGDAAKTAEWLVLFENDAQAGIQAGRYEDEDMTLVAHCVRKWIENRLINPVK